MTKQSHDAERKSPAAVEPSRDLLRALAAQLGLRRGLPQETDLVHAVEGQLPIDVISALLENGFEEQEIYDLVIPQRTLHHRRASKDRLTVHESDRAVRVARIGALAALIFDDTDTGLRWLRSPKKRFGGRTGMEMLGTEAGSRLVEEMLYEIDEGMAA